MHIKTLAIIATLTSAATVSAAFFPEQTLVEPTVSIQAAPSSVVRGGTTMIVWSSTYALSCVASGAWSGARARSGSMTVTVSAPGTYELTCSGRGGTAMQATTVTFEAQAVPPPPVATTTAPQPQPPTTPVSPPAPPPVSPPAPTTTPPVATSTPAQPVAATTSLTRYPNFSSLCSAMVTGNQNVQPPAISYPLWSNFAGACTGVKDKPILFSVTQEKNGSHNGAANNIPNAAAYMGDLNFATDFNKWVSYTASPNLVSMKLDMLNNNSTNVTGWNIREGNMFFGFADMSLASTSLDKDIVIEFDMRIRGNDVATSSGHTINVGGMLEWREAAPRTNTKHFFSVTLDNTPRYWDSLNRVDQSLCHDKLYNTCWYDQNGTYSEGRDVSYSGAVVNRVSGASDSWMHVRVPVAKLATQLGWVSPPAAWSDARLTALIFGLEGTGAQRYWVELKNYQVYIQQSSWVPTPPPEAVPLSPPITRVKPTACVFCIQSRWLDELIADVRDLVLTVLK